MTRWEYYTTADDGPLEVLGVQGWELVAAVPSADGGPPTLYLKRPALSFREQVTIDQKRHYYSLHGIKGTEEDRRQP